ncbi:MAG: TerC/Alx family metal homeostasis membrane protein [Gammaproteobacteria bacterium]|nr:TerC/Alx family metal homeostasis membrane protein [Gammaproteobacteria bacterium]
MQIVPLWMWLLFFTIIASLLLLDLGVFNKKNRVITLKVSLTSTLFYIIISLLFNILVYFKLGLEGAQEYFTGYVIEKSLSLDNIFVISLVFSYFQVPAKYQHRVLFYGIIGALFLRGLMIGIGASLLANFHWIIYIFSLFLILTGIKMLVIVDSKPDISKSLLLKFLRNHLRITRKIKDNKFFTKRTNKITKKKKIWATPLFITLILVEFVDLIFAVDSVPAILAITPNTFIIYTSNIFAILGLRALYFTIAAIIRRFVYLNYALSIILIFIGSKTFAAYLLGLEKFPITISLFVTISVLALGIIFSLYKTKIKPKSPL